MRNRLISVMSVILLISGCSNDSANDSTQCNADQQLFEGKCYAENECAGECDLQTHQCHFGQCIDIADNKEICDCDAATQKCVEGTCVNKYECVPECKEGTEKCFEGTCIGKDVCAPECDSSTQKCVEGACVDKYVCAPKCNEETEKCFEGTCVDKKACILECDEKFEKCYEGSCIDKNLCAPECDSDKICQNGECVDLDPSACTGLLCKDSVTYCDDTGHWSTCEPGSGCHLGHCLKGLGQECEPGTCGDGNMACMGGTWIGCGSVEQCENGVCKVTDEPCDPGTCSDDEKYRCTQNKRYEACPGGLSCEAGKCVNKLDEKKAMLWQLCSSNSDCAHGICLFEVSTSRTMSNQDLNLNDIDTFPVSVLDSRIPEGMGICSQDCTRDIKICDEISNKIQKFKCQVVLVGDSPYPPTGEDGLKMSLPFHQELVVSNMMTAPYASICRPRDAAEDIYSSKFCNECEKSGQCGNKESCFLGMCLTQCALDEQCPIGFSCRSGVEGGASFCVPNSGTCSSCLDMDQDGQGYGACKLTGFDCDDGDPGVYYGKQLEADACSTNISDDNCNGKIDYLELIGNADNCETCGSTCKVAANANNIARQCSLNNGGLELDDSTPLTIEQTYVFECRDACDVGYADCDNDNTNGCETKLFDYDEEEEIATLTDDGVLFALDGDEDGHGITEATFHHYCCKSNADVCYALPNTDTNHNPFWERAVINPEKNYSTQVDDCDDENSARFPDNNEICDGIDNDCDDTTPDGSDSLVKLVDQTYAPANPTDDNVLKLGDTCTMYGPQNSVCAKDGEISCLAKAIGIGTEYQMVCTSEVEEEDSSCNNLDDNCNGLTDEGYVFTPCDTGKDGICKWGVKVCSGGEEKCQQLYEPRAYDFYGDAVDSNCDGKDWDIKNAIFVDKYGGIKTNGNDSHTGKYDSPVATLNKAFEKAKATSGSSILYHDIFVSNAVDTLVDDEAHWGKEKIKVPTVAVSKRYAPKLKPATSIGNKLKDDSLEALFQQEHVKAYQGKINKDPAYKDYKTNDYLFPGEIYPGTEVVRIYGGFAKSDTEGTITWTKSNQHSKYHYVLSQSTIPLTGEESLKESNYEIILPSGSDPMSLRMNNFDLKMTTDINVTSKLTGTTLIGLTCKNNGCDRLVMKDNKITLVSPSGLAGNSSFPSNDNWRNERNGVRGDYFQTNNGGGSAYKTNYDDNVCMKKFYSNGWSKYTNYESSYYNYQCPDGAIPRGGCGGSQCCKGDCGNIKRNKTGRNGRPGGSSGGTGAFNEDCNFSSGCGNDDSVDASKVAGGVGNHGTGGKGGSNSNLSIKLSYSNSNGTVYMATYSYNTKDSLSSASGGVGKSGSGGGGGGIYHCYGRAGKENYWVFAGSGGAGGCGGYGGSPGGTGGSAIGLVVIPPGDSSLKSYVELNNVTTVVEGGGGGAGGTGQNGQVGGQGGGSYGYGKKTGALDYYCMKGTAGGAGGAGGGGGGGAGGLAGHAYGVMFLCNRSSVSNFSNINSDLPNCGINISPSTITSLDSSTTAKTGNNGGSGSDGESGSWQTDSNATLTGPNARADWKSSAGNGGSGANKYVTTGKTAQQFILIKP